MDTALYIRKHSVAQCARPTSTTAAFAALLSDLCETIGSTRIRIQFTDKRSTPKRIRIDRGVGAAIKEATRDQ